jgi:hypothetical protein
METSEMVKLVDDGKNTSIKQCPKFQNCVTSVEDAECFVSPPTSKTHENVMKLGFQIEETKSVKFLTYRKFHLGQFRAF